MSDEYYVQSTKQIGNSFALQIASRTKL